MRSGQICCGPSGVGRWACLFAVRWEKVCGKCEQTCQEIARRVLICLYQDHLVALHGFIKKTRATREADLALARKRQKELEQ